MAGQRETADFAGTGIEDMKHYTLALLDPDRIAVAKHLAVDAEKVVADFIAFRTFELIVRLFADVLQLFDRIAGQKIHRHIAAAAERRQELFEHQKDLAVISARIIRRLDIDRPRLSGIGAAVEVATGDHMGVINTEPRRLWHESDAAHAMRGNEWRALFRSAVDIARDHLAMPVQQLWRVGVVMDVYNDALAFPQPDQRTGKLTVVKCRRHDVVIGQINESGCNADRVVGLFGRRGCRSLRQERSAGYSRRCRGDFQQRAAIDRHGLHSYLSAPYP